MGWFGGKKKDEKNAEELKTEEANGGNSKASLGNLKGESIAVVRPDPTGPLPSDVSVFEFGSSAANSDSNFTLAGYCPVSDEMEPCRWQLLPAGQSEAPGFRILF